LFDIFNQEHRSLIKDGIPHLDRYKTDLKMDGSTLA